MKKIFFYLVAVIFSCTAFAQEKKIYEYDNGIRSLTPSQTVVREEDKVYIYNHDNSGIRDMFPDKVIEDNKVYEVDENGLRNLFPQREIEN